MKNSISNAKTDLLDMAYERSGSEAGRPVFLIHGWPDDPRTWDRLLPALHAQGYQTIAPYLRGVGPTRFLHPSSTRSGEIIALAKDILELADSLRVEKFRLIGHDWGARIAYTLGSLAPDRIEKVVALSVPLNRDNPNLLSETQLQNYWYQWYFSSNLAERRLTEQREGFVRYIWKLWTFNLPQLEKELAETLPSFQNADWLSITLHSYRVQWQLAEPDGSYSVLRSILNQDPVVKVPILSIRGEHDPVHSPAMYQLTPGLCSSSFDLVTIPNAGHFPQRENSQAVIHAILPFLQ
jgi:pimeloyl-ACP methyl ester carboxylesterase